MNCHLRLHIAFFTAAVRQLGVWLLVCALCIPPVLAVEVEGLYQTRQVVSSRNDVRERQQGFAQGLREVLTKVSGRADILTQPGIRRALDNAADYVDSWSYSSRAPRHGETGQVIELQASYFPGQVQALLSDNGIAVWPSNRPYTLLWVITENSVGERRVVSQEEDNELVAALRDQAERRGMPLLMPLMDLEDRRRLDSDRLWSLDGEHVNALSSRYGVDSVLVLRVFSSLGNEFLGRARYFYQQQPYERELYGDSLAELATPAVSLAAEELSSYFAVLTTGRQTQVDVILRVEGIEELPDYAGLLRLVENLSDVMEYQVLRVDGHLVEMKLQTGGQIRQLVGNMSVGRQLRALQEPVREGNDIYLHYRWTP